MQFKLARWFSADCSRKGCFADKSELLFQVWSNTNAVWGLDADLCTPFFPFNLYNQPYCCLKSALKYVQNDDKGESRVKSNVGFCCLLVWLLVMLHRRDLNMWKGKKNCHWTTGSYCTAFAEFHYRIAQHAEQCLPCRLLLCQYPTGNAQRCRTLTLIVVIYPQCKAKYHHVWNNDLSDTGDRTGFIGSELAGTQFCIFEWKPAANQLSAERPRRTGVKWLWGVWCLNLYCVHMSGRPHAVHLVD